MSPDAAPLQRTCCGGLRKPSRVALFGQPTPIHTDVRDASSRAVNIDVIDNAIAALLTSQRCQQYSEFLGRAHAYLAALSTP